jgi:hypothetical protein
MNQKYSGSINCILERICDFWPSETQNKCSNIIGHGSHTKGKTWMGEIGKGKKPKTWMWLMCSLLRTEYSNLKLAETTMGGD